MNKRLDVYVAEREIITRSASQKLIENGCVTVNGKIENKNYKVNESDIIEVEFPEPELLDAKAENIPLNIVYEDNDFIIVNKPKGMVVHPAVGNANGTLVNALLWHCGNSLSGINGVIRPGIIHRIDKDTSGLLVSAKNDIAHASLAEQIKSHSLERHYQAVVIGNLKQDSGIIDAPIGRHPLDRKKMAVVKGGREAVTHYHVLERFSGFTYIELQLETGRTHQIRVHMSSIGHPVAGDTVYGGSCKFDKLLMGQCLHAKTLELEHPLTHDIMRFDSELPEYFTAILSKLRNIKND